jgi:hypothetical protein
MHCKKLARRKGLIQCYPVIPCRCVGAHALALALAQPPLRPTPYSISRLCLEQRCNKHSRMYVCMHMHVCMPRYRIYSYICVIYILYTHKLRRLCTHQHLEQHRHNCNQKPAHHRSRNRLSKRINPPHPQLRKSPQPSVPPNLQPLFRKYKNIPL